MAPPTPEPTTERAWSELSSDLRRFIRRRTRDEHAADDLLQETFLRIHRGIGSLRDGERLAAWVYEVARNVIRDHYRRRPQEMPLASDPAEREEPLGALRGRARPWLDELIDELPEKYREPLRWSELDGLSGREIAERLGISVSGAKSRIQRGRAMLKGVLERCCDFHFDRRGNLTDCDPKPDRTVCLDCED